MAMRGAIVYRVDHLTKITQRCVLEVDRWINLNTQAVLTKIFSPALVQPEEAGGR